MHATSPYIMRNQVKDLVPKLMNFDARKKRRQTGHFKELVIFLFAALGYLMALGLAT